MGQSRPARHLSCAPTRRAKAGAPAPAAPHSAPFKL